MPPTTTINTAQYFVDCVEWCCERFGDSNILSADVHHDESAPHCHALIAPIQDARWVGGKLIDRRVNTPAMRDSFGRQIAARYGLSMVDKLAGKRKAEAVAMVLADIESNHKHFIASNLWHPLRKAIESNPAPFIASMGLVLADKPASKLKTMVQIFTSTGKGAKRETLYLPKANPLGIDGEITGRKPAIANPLGIRNGGAKHQSLTCVGIAFPKSGLTTTLIAASNIPKDDHGTYRRLTAKPGYLFTNLIH